MFSPLCFLKRDKTPWLCPRRIRTNIPLALILRPALIFAFPPQRILPHKRALPSEYFCIIKYLFIYARTNYYIRYDIVDIKLIPALLTAAPRTFCTRPFSPVPRFAFLCIAFLLTMHSLCIIPRSARLRQMSLRLKILRRSCGCGRNML